ncbi:TolC family protein [Helicobacter cetorum]|uniref:Lipase-like protein n=1 Tax=Helicobacter cetorum (strain ATCC BAA-540 / CCUG 52418 / MIT 99-5656) TaxID=1163745 RepID=I0ESH2_HELCM|nr:TolC family protein [Helicobacter cetorum]AFI05891.1 lipase-like protein [Helicobacter cetorum MIT 99-5656]
MKKTTIFLLSLLLNSPLNALEESAQSASNGSLSNPLAKDELETNAQKLSLKNAWNRVLSNHEGLHAQEYGIKRASKLKLAAKLSFLPQIDLSAFYVYLSNPIKMDFAKQKQAGVQKATQQINQGLQGIQHSVPPQMITPQIQAGMQGVMQGFGTLASTLGAPLLFSKQNVVLGALSIIYPIYMGGARFSMVRIADLMQKDAREAYRLKKLSTFQELVSVYYGMVLNTEIADVLEDVEKGHYKHFQNALKMQKVGQIAKVETLSAQVAYDKAHIASIKAKDVLEVSQLTFNSILSSKDNLLPSKTLNIHADKALPDLSWFVSSTLNSYPALKTLENQVQISKENTKLQISKFLPQVSFFGSYIMKQNNSVFEDMIPNWFVGVAGRMPILSPTGRIQKYQASKLAELQVNSERIQAKKDMELLVSKTYKQTLSFLKEYKSLISSVELANENLKLQEQAFMQGLSTNAQVIDARNTLSSIMVEQKSVAYKYIVSLANLMALSDHMELFYDYVY